MKQTFKRAMLVAALISTASFVVACGGGKEEEKEESGPAGSFADAASAVSSPTGTVDASTAADVARAFEQSQTGATGGERENGAVVAQTEVPGVCDSGTVTYEASQAGDVTYAYNDCCITGCCIDGDGTAFVDTTGTAEYSVCATFDVTYECEGTNTSLSYSYCSGVNGLVYAVEVNGDTFAVTGSISNGTGTLTVTGENGSFSCTYTNYSGSCTDSAGGSFSF